MTTANAAVTMMAGNYHEILVTVQNTVGNAIDLTNVRIIKWSLAVNENSDPVLEKSYPASGINLTDPTAGQFTIVLSGVETANITPRVYYQEANYDLYGKTVTALVGTLRIRPTII
jgi:hypothetical protein